MAGPSALVGEQSFQTALDLVSCGNHGRAFAHFLLAVTVQPTLKQNATCTSEFLSCLDCWSAELVELDRIQDAMWCYEQACQVLPSNAHILHATGLFLFRYGHELEGAAFLHKAVSLSPQTPDWKWDLQNASSALVERWHFRMLNDIKRNTGYFQALSRAMQKGHQKVLDIGSGTGLLSILAVRAGARSVIACEMSKVMCNMSNEIIAENGVENLIHVINKKSTELTIPRDLPSRVSLIVTETADAGLLGEHMIESLEHAWKDLLQTNPEWVTSQPNQVASQVIPAGASVFIQIIQSEFIRKQHRFPVDKSVNWELCEVDIASKVVRMASDDVSVSEQCEPYTSENLSQIPGGWTALTDPFKLLSLDFSKPGILTDEHKVLKGMDLSVTTSGRPDAVILWFDLHLDEETTLSSSPNLDSCWEQAVYPTHPVHWGGCGGSDDTLVSPGDTITASYKYTRTWIDLYISAIKHSDPLSAAKFDEKEMQSKSLLYLSQHEIAPLNDAKYQSSLVEIVREICKCDVNYKSDKPYENQTDPQGMVKSVEKYLKNQNYCESDLKTGSSAQRNLKQQETLQGKTTLVDLKNCFDCEIMDISGNLPLLLISRINKYKYGYVGSEESKIVTEDICSRLKSEAGLVHIACKDNTTCCSNRVKLIISDLVEAGGVLKKNALEDIYFTMLHSSEDCVAVPCGFTVTAVCIESDEIVRNTQVMGSYPTLGVKVDAVMNRYKTTTHLFVCLDTLPHKQLTEPFIIHKINFVNFHKLNPLEAFTHQITLTADVIGDGTIVAVPFWFDLAMSPGQTLTTRDRDTHWMQAVYMLDKPVEVKKGETIFIGVNFNKDCFSFEVTVKK